MPLISVMSLREKLVGKNMGLIQGYDFPEDLYYSEKHIWVRINNDETVTLGLTDLARKHVNSIVLIELFLKEGSQIQCNKPFGAVDSAKGTNVLYTPISGKIETRNENVMVNPKIIENSPYTLGWCIKIIPSSLDEELTKLMKGDSPKFIKWVMEEIKRIEL